MKSLIDPNHGIFNPPGKRSPDGLLRKGIYNREIARRLVAQLCDHSHDASLLVHEDDDVSLPGRCLHANNLSIIHCRSNVIIVSIYYNSARRLPCEVKRADWSEGDMDFEDGSYIILRDPHFLTENLFMDT